MRFHRGYGASLCLVATVLATALACRASPSAPVESSPSSSPLRVELLTQDLAVGDNRLSIVASSDGRRFVDGQLHLVFYFLQDPQPVVRTEADATLRADHHEHASLAEHVDAPFYVALVSFDRAGPWGMEVQATPLGGTTNIARLRVEVRSQPIAPGVGSPAPQSASKTVRSAPPEELSSLAPIDPELYALSIAEALAAGRPLVVTFATPAFCTSRTCGPQLHVIAHLKERYPGRANFIHVEIYDNPQEVARGEPARLSPVVQEWRLPTEPWVFVVDGGGLIAARFEGFVTLEELEPAVLRVLEQP